MKHLLLLAAIGGAALKSSAQFSIGSSQPLTLGAGTVFHYDGITLQPTATFTTSAATTLVRNSAIVNPSTTPAIARAYTLSTPLSGFTGTLVMSYATGELGSIPEPSLQLNLHNGTTWTVPGTSTVNTTDKTVTVSGLSNATLGEISLASSSAPLPIALRAFAATRAGDAALLEWTAEARSLALFGVEHSADARTWRTLDTVAAAQTDGYRYTHRNPGAGANYYRLRIQDISGAATYSSVAFLHFGAAGNGIAVWPNPARETVSVRMSGASAQAYVRVTDLAGREVVRQPLVDGAAMLHLQALTPGAYLVQCHDGVMEETVRIIRK